jgi:hypothetical protein
LVGGYEDVPGSVLTKRFADHGALFLGAVVRFDLEGWAEVGEFAEPIFKSRRGNDNEVGSSDTFGKEVGEEGNDLASFTETCA